MKLYELLQAYSFNEIMPVVVDMFPGTGKYRKPLQKAWELLADMKPVPSKRSIVYKIIPQPGTNHSYMGAADSDFNTTWEACLGKDVVRSKGVDLSDEELLANCLVNICFIARHPKAFDQAYQELKRE